jgi:hypothetical protein
VWYKKSREDGRSGGKPPRVSEDEEEDTSHDWKLWEMVTRSSGKPWDWSSGSEQTGHPAGYKESRIGPCGWVDLLQNEKETPQVTMRGAGYGSIVQPARKGKSL